AVFALWGCLWEFEGVEARGQVNRGIKSIGRAPEKGKNQDIWVVGSNVGKRRIVIQHTYNKGMQYRSVYKHSLAVNMLCF
ncbi:hypothetical protein AALF16_25955, partial [Bacillus cereus]|uniref:hypothetical protein n=1 Tax=Bacillus cereus TaxID=1396 RepID=UPI00356E5F07